MPRSALCRCLLDQSDMKRTRTVITLSDSDEEQQPVSRAVATRNISSTTRAAGADSPNAAQVDRGEPAKSTSDGMSGRILDDGELPTEDVVMKLPVECTPRPLWCDDDEACAVCTGDVADAENDLICCDGCNVWVHDTCHKVPRKLAPEEPWYCDLCVWKRGHPARSQTVVRCELCHLTSTDETVKVIASFRQTTQGTWVHEFCALNHNLGLSDTVPRLCEGIGDAKLRDFRKLACGLCKRKDGSAVLQCSVKKCFQAFHPHCALLHNLLFVICETSDEEKLLERYAYCDRHSRAMWTYVHPQDRRENRMLWLVKETLLRLDARAKALLLTRGKAASSPASSSGSLRYDREHGVDEDGDWLPPRSNVNFRPSSGGAPSVTGVGSRLPSSYSSPSSHMRVAASSSARVSLLSPAPASPAAAAVDGGSNGLLASSARDNLLHRLNNNAGTVAAAPSPSSGAVNAAVAGSASSLLTRSPGSGSVAGATRTSVDDHRTTPFNEAVISRASLGYTLSAAGAQSSSAGVVSAATGGPAAAADPTRSGSSITAPQAVTPAGVLQCATLDTAVLVCDLANCILPSLFNLDTCFSSKACDR